MFRALLNVWKVRELRNKLLFTISLLCIYRIGFAVPLPGVDQEAMSGSMSGGGGSGGMQQLAEYFSIFTGGDLQQSTIGNTEFIEDGDRACDDVEIEDGGYVLALNDMLLDVNAADDGKDTFQEFDRIPPRAFRSKRTLIAHVLLVRDADAAWIEHDHPAQ